MIIQVYSCENFIVLKAQQPCSVFDNFIIIVCKPFTQLSCGVSLLLPLMVLTKVGLKAAATEVKWALFTGFSSLLAEQAGTAPPGGYPGKQEGLCEQI